MKLIADICLMCLEDRKRTLDEKNDNGYIEYCETDIRRGWCFYTLDEEPPPKCEYTAEMAVRQEP